MKLYAESIQNQLEDNEKATQKETSSLKVLLKIQEINSFSEERN